MIMTDIWQSLCLDLVISNMYANFIKILQKFQEIGPVSLFHYFQNLNLGKSSTDDKCHFAISGARAFPYQCVCTSLSQ